MMPQSQPSGFPLLVSRAARGSDRKTILLTLPLIPSFVHSLFDSPSGASPSVPSFAVSVLQDS
jgi:hypothetical protein